MSIEQLGYGAGSGFVSGILAAVLAAMGYQGRLKCLENGKLGKDVFDEYRKGVTKQLDDLFTKIDKMDIKLDLLLKK